MVDTIDAPSSQAEIAVPTAMSFAEYILSELRAASLRARLLGSEIDAIGVAVKGGLVTAEQALVLMNRVDLLRVIGERTDDE
jgi:hypothetical protein